MRVPRPVPQVDVLHSPTPSTVRMAASSKGETRNALAACEMWWSQKRIGPRKPNAWRMTDLAQSFSFIHSGIAAAERAEATRKLVDVREEQALELGERLVVEDHMVEVGNGQARLAQAILHGVGGETVVVLAPRKALLLREAATSWPSRTSAAAESW